MDRARARTFPRCGGGKPPGAEACETCWALEHGDLFGMGRRTEAGEVET